MAPRLICASGRSGTPDSRPPSEGPTSTRARWTVSSRRSERRRVSDISLTSQSPISAHDAFASGAPWSRAGCGAVVPRDSYASYVKASPAAGSRVLGWLALTAAAGFSLLWAAYRFGWPSGIDRDVAASLDGLSSGWLDALSAVDDTLFRPTPTFAAAILLAAVLWRSGPRWAWCVPLLIGVTALIEVIVKTGIGQLLHPRALIDGIMVLFGGRYHAPASFPSGHVTRAIFLATTLLLFVPRRASIPFLLLALTVPFARLYAEAHHLSDVMAGAFLGAAIASGGAWAVTLLDGRRRSAGQPPR